MIKMSSTTAPPSRFWAALRTPTTIARMSIGMAILAAISCSTPSLATQSANAPSKNTSGSSDFVIEASSIRHSIKPTLFVRLGEKISRQTLKRRFAGYNIQYAKGEGCLICAVVSGPDGLFDVEFDKDGRTVIRLRTFDDRVRDAQGNRPGSPLKGALGTDTAVCDVGETTTCVSAASPSLHYIVAEDDRCPISVQDKQPTHIPACARIDGFQLDTPDITSNRSNDYTLVCLSQLHQSSSQAETTTKLGTPITVKVQFTGGETTWIDPRDKAETVFENLVLSTNNQTITGGQVKGSTFGSSTSYDGSFGPTGRGSVNWSYAKRFNAFTLTLQKQTYVCADAVSKTSGN